MIFKNTREITIKELKSYFNNPGGYLILSLLLTLIYFLFLKSFFVSQTLSLRGLFAFIPWIFIAVIPAITMGSFAREHENQTIEYLITKPTTKAELTFGKILGSFLFIYFGILLTTPLIYFISKLGALDYGEIFANYLATAILTFSLCAVGVGISSFFKNQIAAFLTTAVIIFALNIISSDLTAINLPVSLSNFLANFSIADHYNSLMRGVIEMRDLVYFIILSLAFITFTYLNLAKIRESKVKAFYKNNLLTILLALIVGSLIYGSAQYATGRIDLTSAKKYTLTKTTRDILSKPDKIKIQVYATPDMPVEFQSKLTELKFILQDYDRIGGDRLNVEYLNPKDNEAQLQALGIAPVQFTVYGEDQVQSQSGYFALVINNEDKQKNEIISQADNINNLEYELSRLINKVKTESRIKVAFASGNGERSVFENYSQLGKLLEADYEIKSVVFPATSTPESTKAIMPNLSEYKLLVIAAPTPTYTKEAIAKIKEFADKGGNIIYLDDTLDIDSQMAQASAPEESAVRGKMFEETLGVKINSDIVYDLKNHSLINISTPQGIAPVRYPYFVFAVQSQKKYNDLPESILAGWASSLELKSDTGWDVLYSTSDRSGRTSSNFNIQPQQNFPQDNLSTAPIIAAKNFDKTSGKIVVASTARILDNDFVSALPQNAYFAISIFEKATDGIGLSTIGAKNLVNQFFYVEKNMKDTINYASPAISAIILAVIGFTRFKRKKLLLKKYSA